MRLSTDPARDEARGISVIHAALDGGVRLLDTADAYVLDDGDTGHNERLIAEALRTWTGDRALVRVATKGGLRRPGGRWVPDGRAKHLRGACEASLRALKVAAIDLYQLHAVDPRTPFETSVRALAALAGDGLIRAIGLCNVTVSQIEAARRIAPIASVQASLGVHDSANLRNGVAEYCRDNGIELIAYRPLGGERAARLGRDDALARIAEEHGITAQEVALAWLLDLDRSIVPVAGATRIESARSISRAAAIRLSAEDRARLDARFPAGRLMRVPRVRRRPPDDAEGDVVIVMGMPGAGKSSVAAELVGRGYGRLNRDERGGRLSSLVAELDAGLAAGRTRWVLDNTYPSRSDRNEVIECAWRHGVPVRCIDVATSLADAQINAVRRMLDHHGRLPSPEELRTIGRKDSRYFGPDAQFRWQRQVEPPVEDEGFRAIEARPFARMTEPAGRGRALILEFDDVLCSSRSGAAAALDADDVRLDDAVRDRLDAYASEGWQLLSIAWRPQLQSGEMTAAQVDAVFGRIRSGLGAAIDFAYCPHAAGPPVCWCRKPLPGLVLDFARRNDIDLARSKLVGRSAADRTLAERLGIDYVESAVFFEEPAPDPSGS